MINKFTNKKILIAVTLIFLSNCSANTYSNFDNNNSISEIEKAIKEMTAQRNYDVEQINRSNNNSIITSNIDTWLKPQETSVKNEKIPQQVETNNTNKNNNNSNRLKYIKIENIDIDNSNYQNQIIDLGKKEYESPKKNVSWGKNETYIKNELDGKNELKLVMEEIEKDHANDNTDIFKLFKKIPIKEEVKNIQTNEDKILLLQQDVKNLSSKIDMIIELLQNNK